MQAVPALNAFHQRSAVRRAVHEIDAGLIERHRVRGGQNADIVHVRRRRIAVAVAVHREIVHDAHIGDALAAAQIIRHGFGRIRHGFEEVILIPGEAARRVPALWIQLLPSLEPKPMEIFLMAPPKPAMACPLKWDSTR